MAKAKRSIEHLKGEWTVAELSIQYKPLITNQKSITSAQEMHDLIRRLWDNEMICLQEQFMALLFNTSQKMIGHRLISTGTMKSCVVDIKLLISLALHTLAENVIIVHNHPSGNLNPSLQDEVITKKIKDALALIDVKLKDHFIVTADGYTSFAEEGLL